MNDMSLADSYEQFLIESCAHAARGQRGGDIYKRCFATFDPSDDEKREWEQWEAQYVANSRYAVSQDGLAAQRAFCEKYGFEFAAGPGYILKNGLPVQVPEHLEHLKK